MMVAFLTALSFLTIVPAPASTTSDRMAPARAYFPLVGLLLGGGLAALDWGLRFAFPVTVTSALLLVALIAATRGLHVEGFLDCCDALFGGFTRKRRLEILKDHHVGAFAAIGGVLLLLTIWSALSALAPPLRTPLLVLLPCLSRWAMLLAMALFPYARPRGLGTAFTRGASLWQVAAGFVTAAAAAALLAGWGGLALVAVASAVSWAFGTWAARLLGGLTGDVYGAVNELAALGVLLASLGLGQLHSAI